MPDTSPNPSKALFNSTALQGRNAVVTGAARGIGRATALALAAAGADVVGLDLCGTVDPRSGVTPATEADLTETGRLVQAEGRRWHQIALDQRDRAAVRSAAATIERDFGPVHILFSNAGIQQFTPLLDMSDDDWDITIDTNLTGTSNMLRAFGPAMKERGYGRIIITTSTQGQKGTFHAAHYSASKWGLIGLMKSAAWELGKSGITVNCLVPGLIDTDLTQHEERWAQSLQISGKEPSGDPEKDQEAAREGLIKSNPLGVPWIDPAYMAPAVILLASDAGSMISGSCYEVTAGDSAKNS